MEGTSYTLGNEVALDTLDEVKMYNLKDITLNLPLGVVYIPNKKPHLLLPNSEYGN